MEMSVIPPLLIINFTLLVFSDESIETLLSALRNSFLSSASVAFVTSGVTWR
jgi:hypothetical protein